MNPMNVEVASAAPPARSVWVELGILMVVGGLFLFPTLGLVSFLDPDEGMYGSIAREIVQRGDWVTLHFNGVRYLAKPPLEFWLSALTFAIFGPSEWGVRIWSALPAFGTALLIWRMGTWLYGSSGGFLSALVFVSSVGVFRYARVGATDFLLVFSITLALFGFLYALKSIGSRTGTSRLAGNLLLYLGMALGVLSKGFLGVVLPLMIACGFLLFTGRKLPAAEGQWAVVNRRKGWLKTLDYLRLTLWSPWGAALFLVLVLPWHLLVEWRNPGFFDFYVLDNQILRFFNSRAFLEDDVPIRTLWFLVVAFVWFFPWSLVLPSALRHGFPRYYLEMELNEAARLMVGTWGLGVLLFFSLSLSKLEHYSLPAIPALSLMVGGRWGDALLGPKPSALGYRATLGRQWSKLHRRFDGLRWCLGLGALGCFFVGGAITLFAGILTPRDILIGLSGLNVYYRILLDQGIPLPFASVTPFIGILKQLGVLLFLLVPIAFLLVSRSPLAGFTSLMAASGGIAFLVFRLDRIVEPHHSTQPVAAALVAEAGPSDLIFHEGSLEYSGGLPFYSGMRFNVLKGKRGSLDYGSRFPNERGLFFEEDDFWRVWQGERKVFLVTGNYVADSVVARWPNPGNFLAGEYGSRSLYTNKPGGDGASPAAAGN